MHWLEECYKKYKVVVNRRKRTKYSKESARQIDLSKIIDFRKVSLNSEDDSIFLKSGKHSFVEAKAADQPVPRAIREMLDEVLETEEHAQTQQKPPSAKTALDSVQSYFMEVSSELVPNESKFRNAVNNVKKSHTFYVPRAQTNGAEKPSGHPQCKGDFADTLSRLDIGEDLSESEGETRKSVGKLKVSLAKFMRKNNELTRSLRISTTPNCGKSKPTKYFTEDDVEQ